MSRIAPNPQEKAPTLWQRLILAAEVASESPTERLWKQVDRLEAEVERLSASVKKLEKS